MPDMTDMPNTIGHTGHTGQVVDLESHIMAECTRSVLYDLESHIISILRL